MQTCFNKKQSISCLLLLSTVCVEQVPYFSKPETIYCTTLRYIVPLPKNSISLHVCCIDSYCNCLRAADSLAEALGIWRKGKMKPYASIIALIGLAFCTVKGLSDSGSWSRLDLEFLWVFILYAQCCLVVRAGTLQFSMNVMKSWFILPVQKYSFWKLSKCYLKTSKSSILLTMHNIRIDI